MSRWLAALERPRDHPARGTEWFASIAKVVLTRTELHAGRDVFRVAEAEFYDYSPGHADPFAHRHATQERAGYWYFHRVGKGYRGGSYKGTDLAFGEPGVPSGILIRAVVRADGTRIDGPSRLTDALLAAAGFDTVAALDAACGRADDPSSALRLIDAPERPAEILATARVGLSLKTHTAGTIGVAADYLFRRYRFLTDPARTRTGRAQLALSLFGAGLDDAQVARVAGFRANVVAGYRRAIDSGRGRDPGEFAGRVLSTGEWLALAGAAGI